MNVSKNCMKQQKRSEILEAALAYIRMGWNIIPVQPDRHPYPGFKWKRFQTERITEEMFKEWWAQYPDCGIAVITGKQSGIMGLDIDAKHDRDISEFNIQPTVIARTQTDGWHVYYKYPDHEVRSDDKLFGEGAGIKAEPGLLVLAPTLGESGEYKWETSPFDMELDEVPEWLLEKIKHKPKTSVNITDIVSGINEGARNTSATSLIGRLLRYQPQAYWKSDVWPLVCAWNKENRPPLPGGELEATFNSVMKLELQRRQTGKETDKEIVLAPALSMAELNALRLPPVDWDIEELIEHGTPNMLSAAPNNYKSWVLLQMGIDLARGTPLFGHFETKQQSVMIVNEEDHISMVKNRKEMLIGNGGGELPLYFHIQKEIKLTDEYVAALLEEAREKKVTFVMFDSLRTMHNAKENDSSEMQDVMDQLMKFVRSGITVLFTHHHRKKPRDPGSKQITTGEESRGSSSINAAVHGHLTCEPKVVDDEKMLVIHQPKLKCAQKIEPFQVKINDDKDMDSMVFEYRGEYDSSRSGQTQVIAQILAALEGSSEWLSIKDLIKVTSVGDSTVRDVLKDLIKMGKVIGEPRQALEKRGIKLNHEKGSHQEKFYQLQPIKKGSDVEQATLDDF